jgi:D-alanyl-D-alanine dipeptidase
MGSPFDFFGPVSHHESPLITPAQAANRAALQAVMRESGFRPYAKEWWHYTLADEPYPDTYFTFEVR